MNAAVGNKHWCCKEAISGLIMEPPCVVVNVIPEGRQKLRRRSGKWLLQMQVRGQRGLLDCWGQCTYSTLVENKSILFNSHSVFSTFRSYSSRTGVNQKSLFILYFYLLFSQKCLNICWLWKRVSLFFLLLRLFMDWLVTKQMWLCQFHFRPDEKVISYFTAAIWILSFP